MAFKNFSSIKSKLLCKKLNGFISKFLGDFIKILNVISHPLKSYFVPHDVNILYRYLLTTWWYIMLSYTSRYWHSRRTAADTYERYAQSKISRKPEVCRGTRSHRQTSLCCLTWKLLFYFKVGFLTWHNENRNSNKFSYKCSSLYSNFE